VRKIDAALDLSWLRSELAPHYSSMGRPSIDPELMIRMLVMGYVFALRSERLSCREVQVNLAYALRLRLGKFGLTLEPTKTKLVEFGRFAQRHAGKRGRNRPETINFLGLTLYCTRNRKGNFKVGMRTEKSRIRRSLTSLQELMQRIRHQTISEQVGEINIVLRGHYAYYGVAGNLRSLVKVYRVVERYWRKMLCSRSWAGRRLTWDAFHQIKERTPLLKPNCVSHTGSCRC
jgi:RNA-directed DNA polymerase